MASRSRDLRPTAGYPAHTGHQGDARRKGDASIAPTGRSGSPSCGPTDLLEVTVLVVGEPLSILLCSRCQWARFSGDGGTQPLDRVIGRIREEEQARAS